MATSFRQIAYHDAGVQGEMVKFDIRCGASEETVRDGARRAGTFALDALEPERLKAKNRGAWREDVDLQWTYEQ